MPDSGTICPECGDPKARAYALCWACADPVAACILAKIRDAGPIYAEDPPAPRRTQRTASPLPRTWDKVLVNIVGTLDPDFDEVDPYGGRAAFSNDISDAWESYGWGNEEMPYARACPIAGRLKWPGQSLCKDCEKIYGKEAADWPEWVHGAVLYNGKWRKRLSKRRQHEIHIANVYDNNALDPTKANAEWKKPFGLSMPQAFSWYNDGYGFLWLPYAPYSDSVLNMEYRRANGILQDAKKAADIPLIDKFDTGQNTRWQIGWAAPDFAQDYDDLETIEEALAAAGQALTRREAQVVKLYVGERLSQDAVAAQLGTTRQAVSFHWRNAVAKLNEFRRLSEKALLMCPKNDHI
jgi:DNA-binding CsgD family transcriptional regulator